MEKTVEQIENVKEKHMLKKNEREICIYDRYCVRLEKAVMNKRESLNYIQKNGEPHLSVWITFK